jgi:NAD(P)-dependent dehydrogenase (short-subunit alcohol dehydrogenase family)
MQKKVVLITGASSGIGRSIAKLLKIKGYQVYGGSRNKNTAMPAAVIHTYLDVTDSISVQNTVNSILEKEGRIDVLINSAGYGIAGPIEQTSIREINSLFNTNFLGSFRMCKAVLKSMRNLKSGTIINISSLGGLAGLPFQGFYSASKFALEGMTEALKTEVAPFGIKVILIEPGNFCTPFTQNRVIIDEMIDSDYLPDFNNALPIIEKDEINGKNSEIIARLVYQILRKPKVKLRYATGPKNEKLLFRLKGILPQGLFETILKKHYNLN